MLALIPCQINACMLIYLPRFEEVLLMMLKLVSEQLLSLMFIPAILF